MKLFLSLKVLADELSALYPNLTIHTNGMNNIKQTLFKGSFSSLVSFFAENENMIKISSGQGEIPDRR